ncbi:MAG: hypothetical protein H7X93_00930 [Sphingomonadaceae bacterium]|nr:hypothetical protein [Sphingomonadaceae bacterium]
MTDTEMLTRLVRQAGERGADPVNLRAIVEEASEAGAARALAMLGLADPGAREDIGELRELLGAWRAARRSATRAAVAWVVKVCVALMLLGLAVRFGMIGEAGR